jgi:hypothetical protein
MFASKELSGEDIRELHKNGRLVGVTNLCNKQTFLSQVEVVWFAKKNEKFPFKL